MNIFIGNLAFTTTEEELAQLFHPYGEIASVRIMTDRDKGRSRVAHSMSCFFSKTSYERCGFSMGCGAAMACEHYWYITTRQGSHAEEKPLSGRWTRPPPPESAAYPSAS